MYRTGNCTFYERPWEINLSDQQEKNLKATEIAAVPKEGDAPECRRGGRWGGSCPSDAPSPSTPSWQHFWPSWGGITALQISQLTLGPAPADWEHKRTPRIQRFSWPFKQPELFNSLKMVQSKFIDNYSANILSSPCGQNHLSNPLISNLRFLLFCYQIPPRNLPRSILKQLRFLLQHYVWWRVSKIQCSD